MICVVAAFCVCIFRVWNSGVSRRNLDATYLVANCIACRDLVQCYILIRSIKSSKVAYMITED